MIHCPVCFLNLFLTDILVHHNEIRILKLVMGFIVKTIEIWVILSYSTHGDGILMGKSILIFCSTWWDNDVVINLSTIKLMLWIYLFFPFKKTCLWDMRTKSFVRRKINVILISIPISIPILISQKLKIELQFLPHFCLLSCSWKKESREGLTIYIVVGESVSKIKEWLPKKIAP